MSIDNYCKINDKTLHLLPFSPSRKRQKKFEIERQWGQWRLNLSAPETMNTIDLITLAQMLQDYQRSPESWLNSGFIDDQEVLKRELSLSEMAKARGLPDKKGNRETILKSIYRWYQAELKYTHIDDGSEHYTRYIFTFSNNDKKGAKSVTINVNKGFLEFCLNSGLMFNWKRLTRYKTGHAQLLDAFLQGTKGGVKGGPYRYRNTYSEDILMRAIGLSDSGMNLREQRRILKNTFKEIHDIGELPLYKFDSVYKRWLRSEIVLTTG